MDLLWLLWSCFFFFDVILPPFSLCSDFLFMNLKVRFNIATHRETKKERATNVEILPESFEESIEQRRHVSKLIGSRY